MSRNLLARIVVSVIAVPIILWLSYQEEGWFTNLVLLMAVVSAIEFLLDEGMGPRRLSFWLSFVAIVLVYFSAVGLSMDDQGLTWQIKLRPDSVVAEIPVILVGFMLLTSGFYLRRPKEEQPFIGLCRLTWGTLWLALLWPFVILNRSAEIGGHTIQHPDDWMLFLFAMVWIGDSFALGFGKGFGKHKLAPEISPNKTIEGALGGLAGHLALAVIFWLWNLEYVGLVNLIILSTGVWVFGNIGDLVQSMWKRSLNLKDSSSILPGHGGVLDRFDSLLFAAPFMYFFRWMGESGGWW